MGLFNRQEKCEQQSRKEFNELEDNNQKIEKENHEDIIEDDVEEYNESKDKYNDNDDIEEYEDKNVSDLIKNHIEDHVTFSKHYAIWDEELEWEDEYEKNMFLEEMFNLGYEPFQQMPEIGYVFKKVK